MKLLDEVDFPVFFLTVIVVSLPPRAPPDVTQPRLLLSGGETCQMGVVEQLDRWKPGASRQRGAL